MIRSLRLAVPALAAAFAIAFLAAKPAGAEEQAPAAGQGAVTGTVVDPDGNPVAGAQVRLMAAPSRPAKGEGAKAKEHVALVEEGDHDHGHKEGDGHKHDNKPKKPQGEAKPKPAPVAEATTGADGSFSMENVPAGAYALTANAKGFGGAREKVTVEAGQTADVKLTLKAPKAKKAKPAEME